MIYFLDSNICINYLNGKSDYVKIRIDELGTDNIQIPSIVAAELYYGAFKSERKEYNIKRYLHFLSGYDIIPFTHSTSLIYGEIRSDLERKGTPIGFNDMLIAAIIIENDGILVTNNIDEFSRIQGLILEDWINLD